MHGRWLHGCTAQHAGGRKKARRTGRRQAVTREKTSPAAQCVILVAAALIVLAAVACSIEARHRTLVFFFDGVPSLETGVLDAAAEVPTDVDVTEAPGPPRQLRVAKVFYNHPAYKQNRCPECHDVDIGGVIKTAREGLCQTCHPDKPAKKKFVHGPVAVNGCLACHLYHKSPYPGVLVADAQTLCFHCHEEGELKTDKHHATLEQDRCIDCHDSHGGDDRFFLTPEAQKLIQKADTVGSS